MTCKMNLQQVKDYVKQSIYGINELTPSFMPSEANRNTILLKALDNAKTWGQVGAVANLR